MTVVDLLVASGEFTEDAYTFYSIIERKDPKTGFISILSADLQTALSNPQSIQNHQLQAHDKLYVLNEDSNTYQATIETIIARLRSQANADDQEAIVRITGDVKHPGAYPLEPNMTVADLIRAAGQYTQSAYTSEAELLRTTDNDKQFRETSVTSIDLNFAADIPLQSFDQILVKRIPDWSEHESIDLKGEVRFPGTYTIERGETLNAVIERAGGLTELAYPEAAIFIRESLRKAEAEQILRLKKRLEEDIKIAKLQEGTLTTEELKTATNLAADLESTQALGRMAIDLPQIIKATHRQNDIALKDGDSLIIPQRPQAVTVIGSVNFPTSHLFDSKLSREDYIALSGGIHRKADKKHIYIVRANGQGVVQSGSRFFPGSGTRIQPGDTIVVPIDVDRMRPLTYWGQVTQIIYNLAIGAAAVATF